MRTLELVAPAVGFLVTALLFWIAVFNMYL
jgi:hypothetical protein